MNSNPLTANKQATYFDLDSYEYSFPNSDNKIESAIEKRFFFERGFYTSSKGNDLFKMLLIKDISERTQTTQI